MTKAVVVIPTFNEAENIGALIDRLLTMNLDVLVVDDNSPDGTSALVNERAKSHPGHVHLLLRKNGKGGRGSATLDGFAWALKKQYDPVIEMDADFSHDPAEIPQLLKASQYADLVVGSRYLPKSKILNWPLRRRIFSRMANLLSRVLLHLSLSDYTNGFRCYRRKALQSLDVDKIPEKGYIVLSYTAAQLAANGCRFAEIPTRFVNRLRGKSQLSKQEIYQAFRGIIKLYLFARKSAQSVPQHT